MLRTFKVYSKPVGGNRPTSANHRQTQAEPNRSERPPLGHESVPELLIARPATANSKVLAAVAPNRRRSPPSAPHIESVRREGEQR